MLIFKWVKEKVVFFIQKFFLENPAFIYSLFFLLGTWARFGKAYFLFLLPLIFGTKKIKIIATTIFTFAFCYAHLYYPSFPDLKEPVEYSGSLKVTSITATTFFNSKGYLYKGRIKKITLDDGRKFKNIPVNIRFKGEKLSAKYLYHSSGKISLSPNSKFILSIKTKEMVPIKKIFSLVDFRNEIKEKTDKKISELIKGSNAAKFLSGQVTGITSDTFMTFSFKRVGLEHILAISGFNFSILVLFFLFFLKKIVPTRLLPFILIFIINLYYFYLGFAPSIFRAYACIQLAFLGQILNKKYVPINTLGISIILEELIDPLNMLNLGFQLSYLCVLAIFIIYPQINIFTAKILKKRTKEDLKGLNFLSRIGAKIGNFLRESFSLTFAVNLAIIPLLLYYFSYFPLLSLIYNLFFPELVFIPLLFLSIALLFSFLHLSLIAEFLGNITSSFTEFILRPVLTPPAIFDYNLLFKGINLSFTLFYLFLIFLLFIILNNLKKGSDLCHPFEII
jgi:competence protein ComEC